MKLFKIKNLFLIIILIINITITIHCKDDEDEYGGDKPEYSVVAEAEDVVLVRYDREQNPEVVIIGKKDYIFRDNYIEMTDFKVLFYGKNDNDQQIHTQLTANFGKVNTKTKDFEARENVIAIKEKELRIETQKIFYKSNEKKLTTPPNELVTIYRVDGTISKGYELEATEDASNTKSILLKRTLTTTPDDKLSNKDEL